MNSVSQEQVLLARPELPYLSNPPSKDYLSFSNTTNSSINEIWTTNSFNHTRKVELNLNFKSTKMSWSDERESPETTVMEEETKDETEESPKTTPPPPPPPAQLAETTEKEEQSPAHHARRPMNAFLIFCKKHRPIVRQKFPNLENRGVTKYLGEWWAQLDASDKAPYTALAKEYKDAFLSANPDFKWYKLPAPPLRTLNTRPANSVPKPILPIATTPLTVSPAAAEFTPGKLADESQLGGLTSLMNMSNGFNNNNNNNSTSNYNNNKEPVSLKRDYETTDQVFDFSMKKSLSEPYREPELPPKPIKKRIFEKFVDNKDDNIFGISEDGGCEPNMTQQELLNKVVDHMFIQDADLSEQPRKKSGRSCKGKRYEQFMVEGKLLSGKREKNQKFLDVNRKFDDELHSKIETFQNRETLNLESTIKRLAERTQTENPKIMEEIKFDQEKRKRTVSEASDDSFTRTVQNEFNLDLRISNLPSLSYDAYMQRKRESKKRKICTKSDYPDSSRHGKVTCVSPIGSKKRKNKHSITHLKKKTPDIGSSNITSDLSGLATLAEIAANTEKIN